MSGDVVSTTALLREAVRWRCEGRAVALATVVDTWGSAPRPPGGHMVICATGEFLGSVSGGCVEPAVIHEAKSVLEGGERRLLEYGISHEDAWAVGLACGGRVRIHLDHVGPGGYTDGLLQDVLAARAAHEPVVLAIHLASGEHALLRPEQETPYPAAGTTAAATATAAAAVSALRDDLATVVETPAGPVLLRPHNPPVRVVIVGAVHLAQALIPLAVAAGFRPIVIDPRDAFATVERFPDVPVVHAWPRQALRELAPDGRTAVLVLSHDAKLDEPALAEALAGGAFSVGALGRRRTHAARLERLSAAGVPQDALARIHAPIGLDIGARTPAEVALAIMADVVATLRRPRPAS
jgi:xanthine dehydrogenase accessory factor